MPLFPLTPMNCRGSPSSEIYFKGSSWIKRMRKAALVNQASFSTFLLKTLPCMKIQSNIIGKKLRAEAHCLCRPDWKHITFVPYRSRSLIHVFTHHCSVTFPTTQHTAGDLALESRRKWAKKRITLAICFSSMQ